MKSRDKSEETIVPWLATRGYGIHPVTSELTLTAKLKLLSKDSAG